MARGYLISILYFFTIFDTSTLTEMYDWTLVEQLAEAHPYVVALLDQDKEFQCSGIIVDKVNVLTSGKCCTKNIHYVALSMAVITPDSNPNSFRSVSEVSLHGDYEFDMKHTHPNFTVVHNNIGLVHTLEPHLELFIDRPEIGEHYASELQEKSLIVYGFGKLQRNKGVVLQRQWHNQTTCLNPKWYYCVCGIEHNAENITYEKQFGEGGPVLLNNQVVGIAVAPCGTLSSPDLSYKYNIFTVVGPYKSWIERPLHIQKLTYNTDNKAVVTRIVALKYIDIFLLIRAVLL